MMCCLESIERTRASATRITRTKLTNFSRSTHEIGKLAREKGIEHVEQKVQLGAKTRNRRQKDLGFMELQSE